MWHVACGMWHLFSFAKTVRFSSKFLTVLERQKALTMPVLQNKIRPFNGANHDLLDAANDSPHDSIAFVGP